MLRITRAVLLAATILTPGAAIAQDMTAEEQVGAPQLGNEIIVTARRREETLQSVPTTVAVVTADIIDQLGLDNLQDIARTTPGLVFDDSFGRDGNRPVIRGQANINGSSGVAYFIDGIYYSGSLADYDVDTIERVEVVKGPQSALYGRNTYSGAINIISKMPSDTWEGRVTADISEFNRYEVTAGIRGPLADGLSAGINGRFYDFGGEFVNQFNGEEVGKQSSRSVAGTLAWDDGGVFTASLRAAYNHTDDGQLAIFAQPTGANNCFFDDGQLYDGGGRYFCGVVEPREVNSDFERQFIDPDEVGNTIDTYNVSLRMDYELSDNLSLVSLTGYNDRTQTQLTDGDYSPESFQTAVFARFPIGAPIGFGAAGPIFPFGFVGSTVDFSFAGLSETRDWSQELKLVYESDAFDFVLGGYYFDQSDDSFGIREVPADAAARAGASFGAAIAAQTAICSASPNCGSIVPLFGPSVPNSRDENLLDIENIAAFAAVNWHITPTVNLGLEGRYAEETLTQTIFEFNEGDPRPPAEGDERTFKAFTPRITLDWQATPDNLIYGIYAEGQKPGGFNSIDAIRLGIGTFEAEDNKTFELGAKNRFLDGDATFNLAGFYTEIDGYQLSQNAFRDGNTLTVVTNGGAAEIKGLEAELVGRPTAGLTLTANYALADTKFTTAFDENEGVLNDVLDDGLVNCSTGDELPDADCQSLYGSITGRAIPRAPKHTAFVDLDYRMMAGDTDVELFVGGNVSYTSTSFAQVANEAETGSATVVDVRFGGQTDLYKVQFYIDNLFDEDAVSQIIRFADGNASFRRSFIAGLRPGRRFGVIVSAGF